MIEVGRNGFPKREECCGDRRQTPPQLHRLVAQHKHIYPNSKIFLPNTVQRSHLQLEFFFFFFQKLPKITSDIYNFRISVCCVLFLIRSGYSFSQSHSL